MSNPHLQEIKQRVTELQNRLGRQLQVTIYSASLNHHDEFLKAAADCRMSIINDGYNPGSKNNDVAVRVVAEGLGEIPYALMCEEAYFEGDSVERDEND